MTATAGELVADTTPDDAEYCVQVAPKCFESFFFFLFLGCQVVLSLYLFVDASVLCLSAMFESIFMLLFYFIPLFIWYIESKVGKCTIKI